MYIPVDGLLAVSIIDQRQRFRVVLPSVVFLRFIAAFFQIFRRFIRSPVSLTPRRSWRGKGCYLITEIPCYTRAVRLHP